MPNRIVTVSSPQREPRHGILFYMFARRLPAGLVPAAICLALAVEPSPVPGQTGAFEVTSDTPEYCLHLFDLVSNMVRKSVQPPPRDVMDLSSEGQRMCDHGQTRGGIMRLRRALLLMQHPGG